MKTTAHIAILKLSMEVTDLLDRFHETLEDTVEDPGLNENYEKVCRNIELLESICALLLDCVTMDYSRMEPAIFTPQEDNMKSAVAEVTAIINHNFGDYEAEYAEVKDALKRVLDLLTALEY